MKYIASADGENFEVEIRPNEHLVVNGKQVQADFQSVADQPVWISPGAAPVFLPSIFLKGSHEKQLISRFSA
jgi:hypothetical protein